MDKKLFAQAVKQAEICSILSNPCRLMILWSLDDGELAVGEIAARVGTTLQNVSQHLRTLKERQLITARRDGHHIYYRMDDCFWLGHCMALTKRQQMQSHTEMAPAPIEALDDYN